MRPEHAQRVVELHAQEYGGEWEGRLKAIGEDAVAAEACGRALCHYTSTAVEQLNRLAQDLQPASAQLGEVTEALTKDERILRTYVGLPHKLRRTLGRQP